MNADPGLICFAHCQSSIYCLTLPKSCPVCGVNLEKSCIIPIRIPYPFVRAKQASCAIVMKPSKRTFLDHYFADADLHIGISTSDGMVVEFDSEGICSANTSLWNQCLVVYQLDDNSWFERWDTVLKIVKDQLKYSVEKYDEMEFNCYSFVLEFVRSLQHDDFKNVTSTKEIFCQRFVIPRLTEAYKYILLFRNVRNGGCLVS